MSLFLTAYLGGIFHQGGSLLFIQVKKFSCLLESEGILCSLSTQVHDRIMTYPATHIVTDWFHFKKNHKH